MRIPPLLMTVAVSLPLALGACGGGDDGGSFESGGEHINVPGEASAVAVSGDSVWVGHGTEGTVAKVDLAAKTTGPPVHVADQGTLISELEIGGGAVWVPNNDENEVVRINAADPADIQSVPVESTPIDVDWSEQGIWTAGGGQATRIDPRTNEAGDPIDTQGLSEQIAVEGGTVWLPSTNDDGMVERISADTGQVNNQLLQIGTQPDPVDGHGGFVWIGDEQEEVLRKIDARTGREVGEPIELGAFPTKVVASAAGVFVLSSADRITRIDPDSGEITGTREILGDVSDIAADDTQLFIAEGRSGLTRVELK